MRLEDYPKPQNDTGRGVHWIPFTWGQVADEHKRITDELVQECIEMNIRWVLILNGDGQEWKANEYLVRKLVGADHAHPAIMPIIRIGTHFDADALAKRARGEQVGLDLNRVREIVTFYRSLGVPYFQLYNEPNLRLENDGAAPDVNRYLDVWIPAAKQVVAAGGLPGFGALSPQGEVDDRDYLERALRGLRERGEEWLLDRGWLSMHNYAGNLPLDNPDGFLRFRQYADILKQELGRIIPIVGTEAGTYVNEQVDEAKQVDLVSGAYRYMASQAEPYTFAYTYWILANQAGGGHDQSFEWQALFKRDGWVSPLVDALKRLATGVR